MEFADLSVDWRSGGQDITQPGIYQVAVTPRPPFEGVPLACPEAEITLTVVEEGLPYLRRAYHDVHTERDILELYGPMPGDGQDRSTALRTAVKAGQPGESGRLLRIPVPSHWTGGWRMGEPIGFRWM